MNLSAALKISNNLGASLELYIFISINQILGFGPIAHRGICFKNDFRHLLITSIFFLYGCHFRDPRFLIVITIFILMFWILWQVNQYRSASTVHCSASTVHRSAYTVKRSPFPVQRSESTVHRSQF